MTSAGNPARKIGYVSGELVAVMVFVGVLAVCGGTRGAEQSRILPADQERNMKIGGDWGDISTFNILLLTGTDS